MTTPNGKNKKDDYKPEDLIKKVADGLERPEEFAGYFQNACNESKKMDEALSNIFINLLKTEKIKKILEELIEKVDKKTRWNIIKKIGFVSWSLLIFVASTLFIGLVNKFLK